jgi:signal transduction histidine kinase
MADAGFASQPAGHVQSGFWPLHVSGPLRLGWLRYWLGVVLLAALYYGVAHLGYALQFTGPVAAIVWLPVGVGISFLYIGGLRYWPGVLIGDLFANNYSTLPVGSAVGQTCGNVLEVLLAAALIRRLVADGSPLGGIRRAGRLFVALAAGTAVSATVGLLSLRLGGVVTTGALPKLWRTWWLGDLCGALIVVPLVLAWFQPPSPRVWLKGRVTEAILVVFAVGGLSELALRTTRPVAYLVFPALMLAALRFGERGATVAVAIASGHAVWATTHYVGPFVYQSIPRSILATQLYIAVAALSTVALAVVVSERDDFDGRLQASRVRLVKAADLERRRIELNLHDGAQQRLTALAVFLGIAADEARHSPAQAPALFGRAERDLLVAIDELRELAHGMHPWVLRRQGLADAIGNVTARSRVPVELIGLPWQRFDDGAEGTAYFVLVEAITNAQKHSRATAIRVRTAWSRGVLDVEVADDGVGGAQEGNGLGLEGLRDRVEAFGGTFIVDSPNGSGTRVAAAIPATRVSR